MVNSSHFRLPSRPFTALKLTLALALIAVLATVNAPLHAQAAARQLGIEDYTRWKSISGSSISGDGNWAVYELRQTNVPTSDARPTLHLVNLVTNETRQLPNASGAQFTEDSRWVAYSIEPMSSGRGGGGGGGRGAAAAPPGGAAPPATGGAPAQGGGGAQGRAGAAGAGASVRRVELRNLATNDTRSWEDIQSFSFSPGSRNLLLRRRQAVANATHRGVDVVFHDLGSRRDLFIGSVGESSFNKQGDLLAYIVDAAVRDGNGLFILEPATGRTTPIDNDARIYSRLTWNTSGTSLAVLKGLPVDRMRERSNVLLAYPDVRAILAEPAFSPVKLDPASTAGFDSGWVVSERAAVTWSDSGQLIFFGTKEQVATPDTSGRRGADFVADVDVWRTQDERVQSLQMVRAEADRNFTYRQAFDVAAAKYIKLTDSTMRDLSLTRDGRWGIGLDSRAYVSDYERPRADVFRVNTLTGERTAMLKGQITGHNAGTSNDSRYFLYWKDNNYHALDLRALTTRSLTRDAPVSFVDTEFDNPGVRPAYGLVGYTSDDKSVILEHRYDMWLVSLDGSAAPRNITKGVGSRGDIRFSYVRIETDTAAAGAGGGARGGGAGGRGIDLSRPMLLSAYGQWTKKSGFYELRDGEMREIVYDDASYSTPTKAAKAEKFIYTRQTFNEYPDLRVSGPGLTDARKISDANPQHSEYSWGKRILFDFKNKSGVRLQGTLAIPDDYKPGEKRPMLVNFYEKNSQNLHRYQSPSFITGMGSVPAEALSQGYLVMQPDIHFRTGSSHSDMLECVEAAVRKVIEMGYVDPKRIGLNGHSYGGEGAAYIATRSKLFAAVGVGAGVTDLTSDFTQNWGWSYTVPAGSGATAFNYYIYGQGRWGTNPWESPELYRTESARTHAKDVTAAVLIMHGTADPTVSFQEGMGFYNALRFNNKNAVLLAYPGEGHGLRGLANRRDLTIRYMQFFDHYLKGKPAPKWVSEGVPFLAKDGTKNPGE